MISSDSATDARVRLGWLHRRFGWGERADQLAGTDDPVTALFSKEGNIVDPWGGRALTNDNDERSRTVREWFAHGIATTTPVHDRRTFELHGWLVSSLGAVPAPLMVEQLRLFDRAGAGSFPDLLRAVTIDAAMLVYLDGRTSRAANPNENYARELLELFSLGSGFSGALSPYVESDVAAAAAALTGWAVRRGDLRAKFVPRRHDDSPGQLLGTNGVNDVDGVIDAIVSHPEHDRFVAAQVARRYVGVPTTPEGDELEPDADTIDELASAYRKGGRRLDYTIETAARIVSDNDSRLPIYPIVAAPVPWMLGATRQLGVSFRNGAGSRDQILAMGQVPLMPPSAAGWPGGRRWLTTSKLVGRTNVAAEIINGVADSHPARAAAIDGDVVALADILSMPTPFGSASTDAIRSAGSPSAALTLALVSPEYLLT